MINDYFQYGWSIYGFKHKRNISRNLKFKQRFTIKISKGNLNSPNQYFEIFPEGEFIEKFDVTDGLIKIMVISMTPKSFSPSNRIVLGNVQSSLTNFINQHFNEIFSNSTRHSNV